MTMTALAKHYHIIREDDWLPVSANEYGYFIDQRPDGVVRVEVDGEVRHYIPDDLVKAMNDYWRTNVVWHIFFV